MSRTRVALAAFLVLLLLPTSATGRTMGIHPGDSAVFSYQLDTITEEPVGNTVVNHTDTVINQFVVSILSINTTKSIGEVGYRESVNVFNSTTAETPSIAQNLTAIFDPRDNRTYLGKIGFYPFTYIDLPAGSVYNLKVYVTIAGIPGSPGSHTSVQLVNATVTRSLGTIDVRFTVIWDPKGRPWSADMQFSPVTGLLENGTLSAYFFQTTRVFTYHLVSYQKYAPIDYTLVGYVGIAALGGVLVYAVLTRKSSSEKKVERVRRKFGRRTRHSLGPLT
ncbi:MAG: hypothetical protein HY247_04100 [archaeon]|nr:MAG: hypothetical protein HY247_04100 [archaeon]